MSGRRHNAPRYGSSTHIALRTLHELEGQALGDRWRIATAKSIGLKAAYTEQWDRIVNSLIGSGMVFQRNDVYLVSDEGLVCLGAVAVVVPRANPEVVPARSAPAMRPLSAKHLVNVRSTREGAFDYRDIPSLHGIERVEYRSSLNVAGVSQE